MEQKKTFDPSACSLLLFQESIWGNQIAFAWLPAARLSKVFKTF